MGRYLHPNHLKYIKAPTIEMIDKVMAAHGVEEKTFERFYGMYYTAIKHVRRGIRQLPVQHWHIIYESLKLIAEGKPLSPYKDEQPLPPKSAFKLDTLSFAKPKKKKKPRKKTIKRTGTLCELC